MSPTDSIGGSTNRGRGFSGSISYRKQGSNSSADMKKLNLPFLAKSSRSKSINTERQNSNKLEILDSGRYSELKDKLLDKSTSGYKRYMVQNSLPYLLTLQTKETKAIL